MSFLEDDNLYLPGCDNMELDGDGSQIYLVPVADSTDVSLQERVHIDTMNTNIPHYMAEEPALTFLHPIQDLAQPHDNYPPSPFSPTSDTNSTLTSVKHSHKRQKLTQLPPMEKDTAAQQPVQVAQVLEQAQKRQSEQRFCPICHMGQSPLPCKTASFKYSKSFKQHIIQRHLGFFAASITPNHYTCLFCPCPCTQSEGTLVDRQFSKDTLTDHLWAFHSQSLQQQYSLFHFCFLEDVV